MIGQFSRSFFVIGPMQSPLHFYDHQNGEFPIFEENCSRTSTPRSSRQALLRYGLRIVTYDYIYILSV